MVDPAMAIREERPVLKRKFPPIRVVENKEPLEVLKEIINESGLYALLFNMEPQKSAKQSNETVKRIERIKNFRRWVTHEVLPSIRKYGAYITPQKLEEVLMNPDAMIKIIQNFIKLQQKGEP